MIKVFTKYLLLIFVFIVFINSKVLSQNWQKVECGDGTTAAPRHESSYVKSENKFYLLGARNAKETDIFDPEKCTWSKGAKPPIAIHHFQGVAYNNKIYVIGAFTGGYPDETPVANIYIYNIGNNTWETGPEIPEARRRGSAGAVIYNNKIYVVSGLTHGHTSGHVTWFDEYDPSTNTWKTLPDAPHARDHFNAAVINNKLYLISGRRSSYPNTFGITVAEVDVYDFSTGKWTTLPNNLPTPRAGAGVTALNNSIYVIGGESMAQTAAHANTEILDTDKGTWSQGPSLIQGRHGTQAISYNNAIYIAAGNIQRGGGAEINTQEVLKLSGTTLLASPESVVFGEIKNQSIQKDTIKISNQGNTAIEISNITLSGSNEYSILNIPTLPYLIKAGETIDLYIQFSPNTEGVKSGTINLSSNTQTLLSIDMTGESVLFVTGTLTDTFSNLLSVYPNPFHDHIQLSFNKNIGTVTYEVFNAIGVKHFSGIINTNEGSQFKEEESFLNLPNGLYYIKVYLNDKNHSSFWKKIVKR